MAKTGLEILTDLVDQIRLLNQRMDLLDQNIKILMNQSREKKDSKPQPPAQSKPKAQAIEPPTKQQEPKPGKMTIQTKNKKEGAMTSGKVVVMVDKKPIPIYDATIRIFDDKDNPVRETKTNRGGIWLLLLSPGKYVAEISGKYKGKDLVTQNKNFTVPAGVETYEVI